MSEIVNKRPAAGFHFTIGKYRLSPTDEGWMWLTNESGEGMQIWCEELERMLEQHFKDNF
jgi:hypothetical protein